MILPSWFDYLEERFSWKDVQFKKVLPLVKTSCPLAGLMTLLHVHVAAVVWISSVNLLLFQERCLLEHVLQDDLLCALLASDVWCFMAR